jgi:hypothetical protein
MEPARLGATTIERVRRAGGSARLVTGYGVGMSASHAVTIWSDYL